MGLFLRPIWPGNENLMRHFFPNCGNPARPRSRINTVRESVMDSGITNNIESLSRLLTIQMIFRIIVYHSIINSILTCLNNFRAGFSWIQLDFVYFWNCEQINPAYANSAAKLKWKRIEKQNVIFSLELRSRLEILRALAFDLNSFLFIEQ